MPAVLDREKAKVDGLAFMGLSLSHRSENGNPLSAAHQQAFDFNRLTDRDYRYIQSSDDDGWMIGGGEPETSYKFPAPDSAHIELMHIGTYTQSLGGLDPVVLAEALKSGEILIPEMAVVPTSVCLNDSKPPDLQIRFDMVPNKPNLEFPVSAPLPVNWQLRFVHNQLFKRFHFPCRYCTQPFHAKMMGKVEFRSKKAEEAYMHKCQLVIDEWLERGQQPLVPPKNGGKDASIKTLRCKKWAPAVTTGDDYLDGYYKSGIWLFTDRNTPTHQFMPNFLPPYDTPAKRKIILDVLREEWDETILDWKPLYQTPPMSLSGNKAKSGIELEGMDKINKKAGFYSWDLLGQLKEMIGLCDNMGMDDDLSAMSIKAAKRARIKAIANMSNIMSPSTTTVLHEAYTEEEEDDGYGMTDEERDDPSEIGMRMSSMNSMSLCGSLSAGGSAPGVGGVIPLKNGFSALQRSRSEKPRSSGLMSGTNPELEDTASF